MKKQAYNMKQRLLVLTDINDGGETDDRESLVRLLLYSNEIDIEGLITVTSCWQKNTPVIKNKDLIYNVLNAYEKVLPNLKKHADGYSSADQIRANVYHGIDKFGQCAGDGFCESAYSQNEGVRHIIRIIDSDDPRPVWCSLWGGANTLAQAIYEVDSLRSKEELDLFLSKIRIYGISDQDNAGHWLRAHYGDRLFYIVSPSPGDKNGVKYYCHATWPGIAADAFRHGSRDGLHSGGFKGAEAELISKKWLKENIQSCGTYGSVYPMWRFIMEGDSPAYIGLIPNGLNDPEHPEYGGWGGRYAKYIPDKAYTGTTEKHPIWTNASDAVLGSDGKLHTSPQATIWRWRNAFQHDFAARMRWTTADTFEKANHPPIVNLAHQNRLTVKSGNSLLLSAQGTYDPDGDSLVFSWQYYHEAGNYPEKKLNIYSNGITAHFHAPDVDTVAEIHVILSVTDNGTPPITRYQRIIITVIPTIQGGCNRMKKQAYNPYLPCYEYIPDGEPRIFDGRLFVFGSHDKVGGKGYCENDYVTWSAPLNDLSDWRYEGVIYRKTQDPRPGDMYAPDVVQGTDGKYYLYYSKADSSVTGVAIADKPAGPYEFYGEVKYKDGRVMGEADTEYFHFDPSVLVDDDGRVWMYSGSGQYDQQKRLKQRMVGCMVIELEKDMKTVKGAPKIILPGSKSWMTDKFFEGASARKIGSLYYLVYPVRNGSGLHYATSNYPDRDFLQRGRIHSTSDFGINGHRFFNLGYPMGNNHGGMVNASGQWYIFDHRRTISHFARQGIAEPITINSDGTINQVEATSCGLNGKPLKAEGKYPAYIACNLMCRKYFGFFRHPLKNPNVKQDEADGDETALQYITGMKNGYVAGYKYFDFQKTAGTITLTVRSSHKGKVTISTKEDDQNMIAKVEIGQSETWKTVTCEYHIQTGKQALFFTYHGKGSMEMLDFSLV